MNLIDQYASTIMFNTKKTQGNNIMEFIIISLFIFVFVAWFAVARDIRRDEHRQDIIQKIFDDGIS